MQYYSVGVQLEYDSRSVITFGIYTSDQHLTLCTCNTTS